MHTQIDEDSATALLARRAIGHFAASRSARADGRDDTRTDALLGTLLRGDAEGTVALLCAARKTAGSFAAVADGPIHAAFQQMGRLWDSDAITFVDATRASATLCTALVRAEERLLAPCGVSRAAVLLATLPGQGHTIGASLAAMALREGGYDVVLRSVADPERIVQGARAEGVAAVAITVGCGRCARSLARAIVALRMLRPAPRVLLGGPLAQQVAARLPVAAEPDACGLTLGSLMEALADASVPAHA